MSPSLQQHASFPAVQPFSLEWSFAPQVATQFPHHSMMAAVAAGAQQQQQLGVNHVSSDALKQMPSNV